jgi:hypothetical protein
MAQGFAQLSMCPSKAVDIVAERLGKALEDHSSCLLSVRDYEVAEESRRPRSDAKEQV